MNDPATAATLRLNECWQLEKYLEAEMESAVVQAREAGLSWEAIGTALRRPRQVVHTRFAGTAGRPKFLELPALEQVGGSAVQRIEAAAGVGGVQVHVVVGARTWHVHVAGADRRWSGTCDGKPATLRDLNALKQALPATAIAAVEQAAEAAHRIAQRRQGAIQKRLATIAERGSNIGRPRRRAVP